MARLNTRTGRSPSNDSLYRLTPAAMTGDTSPALSFSSEKENPRDRRVSNGKGRADATSHAPAEAGQHPSKRRRLESLDDRRASRNTRKSSSGKDKVAKKYYNPDQNIAQKQKIRLAINENVQELQGKQQRVFAA
jgi:hypothetical protein